MVKNLGMKFEGRPHSGIDDARNIARILQKMIQDGCEIKFNHDERLFVFKQERFRQTYFLVV